MQQNQPGDLKEETLNRLNDLIRLNIDSVRGFTEAADVVSDQELKARFRQFAQERQVNVEELKRYVKWSDEEPEDSGSTLGAVHRWWLDLRAKAAGGDPGAVLSEAERGEDAIKNEYEEALRDLSGSPVRNVVERQYENVRRGHDQVRALRDSKRHRTG